MGLKVSTDLSDEVRKLMQLYPQPRGRRPSGSTSRPLRGPGPAGAAARLPAAAAPLSRSRSAAGRGRVGVGGGFAALARLPVTEFLGRLGRVLVDLEGELAVALVDPDPVAGLERAVEQ